MKKFFLTSLLSFALFSPTLLSEQDAGRFAIKGGIASANVSIVGLGTLILANVKLALGGEYWFHDHLALGADLGMGGEGFGKVIGTTSASLVNLKTGDFVLDPGVSVLGALKMMGVTKFYGSFRVGFPMLSGYPGALSLSPQLGALIFLNEWAALDFALSATVTSTFKFNYLATNISLGSIGLRVML